MKLQDLKKQKEKYKEKADYFKRIECDMIAADFIEIVALIADLIKEFGDGKD